MQNQLPAIDPLAQAHSQAVLDYLIKRIKQEGPLNFVDFMNLALYAPGLGYYVVGTHKLGRGGDFITAPELSPLFSRCLAQQCAELITHLRTADILELGAGSGRMALDILFELERLHSLPEHYFILELSPELQQRQQQLFAQMAPHFLGRVQWVNQLPNLRGIILANEVLDAMPVHRFKQSKDLLEYYVVSEGNKLQWHLQPASEDLKTVWGQYGIQLSEGYESEINLQLPAFIKNLAEHLSAGLMLFIDYGFPRHEYYHPQRSMGTLMCHYQHQAHAEPLILPGIQDITAHVDFTAIAEAAAVVGLEVAGFVNQASFLMNCGLTELMESVELNQHLAVKRLLLPSEMGELFKVIGLSRDLEFQPLAFKQQDQRHRL